MAPFMIMMVILLCLGVVLRLGRVALLNHADLCPIIIRWLSGPVFSSPLDSVSKLYSVVIGYKISILYD